MGHDLYNNSFESQHVNKPTRGDNILDLVLSTNDNLVSKVNMGPKFGTSDHKIVSFNVNHEVYKEIVSQELINIYRKESFEKLRKILSDNDWSKVDNETDIN